MLVSIGYSACHWCHVMERESFEDPRTAELMNERFVCVKVDREERPDVDALYMEAVQGMTGRGGWPLNVFLTPEQLPFYGGTYFPPEPRHGMPAWTQVLHAIAESWSEHSEEIRTRRTAPARAAVRRRAARGVLLADPREAALDAAVAGWRDIYDCPQRRLRRRAEVSRGLRDRVPAARAASVDMALETLRAMAGGGLHDHVGGGFARYSVDAAWTVPHFEKMLYDNALLARAYLHGWQAHRRAAPARCLPGHARLGAARDARTRGWLLLRARRRLRGRRGALLRVEPGRARGGARRGRRCRGQVVRRHGARELRGSPPPPAGAERAAGPPIRGPRTRHGRAELERIRARLLERARAA